MLGPYRGRVATSITIGIENEEKTCALSREWIQKGFRILKIKGGIDWEADVARLRKVRELVGKDVVIRFDANQGYDLNAAIKFSMAVVDVNIEFIEQPTPKHERSSLSELSRLGICVMADEALLTFDDAYQLHHVHGVDRMNVKLMKVGGVLPSQSILGWAEEKKIKVMLGCMDESALSISAALAVALSEPSVSYVDLDGHIGLLGDPFSECVRLDNGDLIPNDAPGLGYELEK